MDATRAVRRGVAALAIVTAGVAHAGATTLRRASLDELTATNETIVVGEVVDTRSYWNAEGTFILTDVRVAATDVLKGKVEGPGLTVTIMGGTIDDTTALIVGGAELVRGSSYVLFLDQADLPGAAAVRTVRHHSQGVFRVVDARDGSGPRAVSQANGQALVADASGAVDAPGGTAGFALEAMKDVIRKSAGHAGSVR
jgi:hypothetical protein